jgi:hypothetical protein
MGVEVIKVVDKNDKWGTVKQTIIYTAENYREATAKVDELNAKENKPNVKYKTGNIIAR